MKKLIVLLSIFVLASCSTTNPAPIAEPINYLVQGNIDSFSELKIISGDTIYIGFGSEGIKGTLEFKTYANKMTSHLEELGFIVNQEIEGAKYILFFNYGVGDEKIRFESYQVPTFGPTGGGTTTFFGDTAYTSPSYGYTGTRTQTDSLVQFSRFVTIDIFTQVKKEKVYEMTLKSSGSCSVISQVMDEFMQAIFKSFPNNSGTFEIDQDVFFDC